MRNHCGKIKNLFYKKYAELSLLKLKIEYEDNTQIHRHTQQKVNFSPNCIDFSWLLATFRSPLNRNKILQMLYLLINRFRVLLELQLAFRLPCHQQRDVLLREALLRGQAFAVRDLCALRL